MNDRTTYIPRDLTRFIASALKSSPVVVITGARQTGKSTLVQNLEENGSRLYDTLNNIDTLELATSNPDALVRREASSGMSSGEHDIVRHARMARLR